MRHDASGIETALAWWRETICGIGGHAMMLRLDPGRVSLQCMDCGRNTPGWTVGARAAVIRVEPGRRNPFGRLLPQH